MAYGQRRKRLKRDWGLKAYFDLWRVESEGRAKKSREGFQFCCKPVVFLSGFGWKAVENFPVRSLNGEIWSDVRPTWAELYKGKPYALPVPSKKWKKDVLQVGFPLSPTSRNPNNPMVQVGLRRMA